VLIVDDDAVTLTTFKQILAMEGHDVVTAQGGQPALEIIRTAVLSFDVILSDLRMPDRSGLELLAEARESAPGVPFVLYSAYATHAIAIAARQLGAVDILDGFIDVDRVISVVRSVLQRSKEPIAPLRDEQVGPAAERWAKAVNIVIRSHRDIPTVAEWAKLGTSMATLKKVCEVCGVSAGVSLDFARALRIVLKRAGHRCDWYDELDVKEPETMKRFLARAGFPERGPVPPPDVFRFRQLFISSPKLLTALFDLVKSY